MVVVVGWVGLRGVCMIRRRRERRREREGMDVHHQGSRDPVPRDELALRRHDAGQTDGDRR